MLEVKSAHKSRAEFDAALAAAGATAETCFEGRTGTGTVWRDRKTLRCVAFWADGRESNGQWIGGNGVIYG